MSTTFTCILHKNRKHSVFESNKRRDGMNNYRLSHMKLKPLLVHSIPSFLVHSRPWGFFIISEAITYLIDPLLLMQRVMWVLLYTIIWCGALFSNQGMMGVKFMKSDKIFSVCKASFRSSLVCTQECSFHLMIYQWPHKINFYSCKSDKKLLCEYSVICSIMLMEPHTHGMELWERWKIGQACIVIREQQ